MGKWFWFPGRPCGQASWRLHINCAESAWGGWFPLQILHNYRGNTGHNNKIALPYLSTSECHQKLPIARKGGKSVFECFRLMNEYIWTCTWNMVYCEAVFVFSSFWFHRNGNFFLLLKAECFFQDFLKFHFWKIEKIFPPNFLFLKCYKQCDENLNSWISLKFAYWWMEEGWLFCRIQHILCMSPLWAGLPTTLVSIHFLKFSLDFSYLFHTCAFHWSTFQEKDIKYIITYGHGDACSTSIRSFFILYWLLGATRLAGNIIETNKVTHAHTCFYFHIQIGTGERSCDKDFITYVNPKKPKLTTAYGFLCWV